MQDVVIHNPNQNNTIGTFSLYQLIPKTCNCPSRFILYLAPNAFLCSHNYLSPFSVLLVLLEPFPCVETNTKTLVPAPHPSNVTSFLNVPYTHSFNIMSPCSFIFPNQLFQSIKLVLTIFRLCFNLLSIELSNIPTQSCIWFLSVFFFLFLNSY